MNAVRRWGLIGGALLAMQQTALGQTVPQQADPTPGPAVGAVEEPPRRHGFLALPFAGINSFQGDAGTGLDYGFRAGALVGGRVMKMVSVNGEVLADFINRREPGSTTTTEYLLALSPLFHLVGRKAEAVVGPKIGMFNRRASGTLAEMSTFFSGRGLVLGLNAGTFLNVSRFVSAGILASLDVRNYTHECTTWGAMKRCNLNLPGDETVVGVAGAVLF